jgi:predicted amidohydrolase
MFVVAANRCGTTDDTTFGGHSMIVGPDGVILLEAGDGEEARGLMIDSGKVTEARSLFSTVPKRQGKGERVKVKIIS